MSYRLTITRFEPNPNYDAAVKDYERHSGYGMVPQTPAREIETRVLETVVTDAEFVAIKKAVLEVQ